VTAAVEVEAPAIVDGLPADVYHADVTSISSTGLRALLNPGCPAQFKYDRDHPQPPKREFDLGNAVHAAVLGEGHDIVEIDAPDYKKGDAQAAKRAAYAAGKVPLLPKEKAQVDAMTEAIRQHPVAGPLFAPGTGVAERSIYWTDTATGVRCRVRPDWMPARGDGRLVVVDYKTCRAADPASLQKAVYEHGYHQQAALYLNGVKALDITGDQEPAFVFVFQTKTAPYLVHLVELDFPALALGAARNERALRIYADCERTGIWPGFNDAITYLPLPVWGEKRDQEEYL
jgi:hypothetical protein